MPLDNITIADTENLHLIGLKYVLQKNFRNSQITEFHTKKDLLRHLKKEATDLLIIDYKNMDDFFTSEISDIKALNPDCRIIVISDCQDKQEIALLLQSGINAYLYKNCEEKSIVEAIKKIEKGNGYLCPATYTVMVAQFFQNDKSILLTPRELEIVKQIALGTKGKDIADTLFISIHTFRTHRKNIMKKIGVNSTSELIVYVLNNNLS